MKSLVIATLLSFACASMAQDVASHQLSFDYLKERYTKASQPASVDDFDEFLKPSKMRCVGSSGSDLKEFFIPKKYLKYSADPKPDPSDAGPLFPGQPTGHERSPYVLISSNYENVATSDPAIIRATVIQTLLVANDQELVNYFSDRIYWRGDFTDMRLRKDGAYIFAHIEQLSSSLSGERSKTEAYFYCWR